jgi:hypothetical protein
MNLDVATGPLPVEEILQLTDESPASALALRRRQQPFVNFEHIRSKFPFLLRPEPLFEPFLFFR